MTVDIDELERMATTVLQAGREAYVEEHVLYDQRNLLALIAALRERDAEIARVRTHRDEMSGAAVHLRNALDILHREARRDWLDGVRSDAALDALEYASRTLKAIAVDTVRKAGAP